MGHPRKTCTELGCNKLAASGGLCVGHGGGKMCQFPGCTKGYQRGGFCRNHGGGSRCTVPFCIKVDAGHGLCRSHGGGKRCKAVDCGKADVGGGYCTAHGGGKRCGFPSCDKNSQGGGFCRAHGGGRRCTVPDCTKMGRGASGKCPEHGGSPLCNAPNCRKIARDGQGRCREHSKDIHNEVLSQTSDDSDLLSRRVARPSSTASSQTANSPLESLVMLASAPPVAFAYRRLLVQVQLQVPWTELRVLALLQSEPQVRSVHILGYRHSSAPRQPKSAVCFVVRWAAHSSAALELALGALDVRYSVLENSLVEDMASLVVVETILKVNGMMCVANCGNTVVRAIQSVASVLEVHLEFDDAQVVVQSHNTVTAHALIARIQAIGFEADLVSVTPVPWHRQYVQSAAITRFNITVGSTCNAQEGATSRWTSHCSSRLC
ncbi:hypothetical protein, variant [Aphanomyces astaci]|uniref:WRKY19-like zinc finger domain-containing protein n=1 Tax=Aphanomyces astaci TaxID=112090 RepID=W4G004_APHAT|nr:hypothetical protein, variant [Aphanomyces astaci]ETV72586.1 hypothetical protein, variant [Aphanomyces astaci]|eukprot:XP_009837814.1 hypothetical protein, variant [Aphanomyces astaci]